MRWLRSSCAAAAAMALTATSETAEGVFTSVDVPFAMATTVEGINASGDTVGFYILGNANSGDAKNPFMPPVVRRGSVTIS